MFGEIRENTGGKGGGIVEGGVVEEMRENEGQGAQDRNMMLQPVRLIFTYPTSPSYFVVIPFRVVKYSLIICTIRIT